MSIRRSLAALLLALAVPTALAASEAVDRATQRSQQDLDASLAQLTALRESIAGEKLPLTQRLSELETRLSTLRREHEQEVRDLDTGALAMAGEHEELKLRKDEIGYVGKLLDEYARTFESRLTVSELERYAPKVSAAKQAAEDASLPENERLSRQTEVARASLARLDEVIGGARFPGQAVDDKGTLTEGEFAVVGPLAYFASRDRKAVGVALPQTGTVKAAVRPLEPAQNDAIAAVVTEGHGSLPVDATRGAALKALIQRTSLIHIFQKGGPIMWPLLVVSILAFGTVIERLFFLANEQRKRDVPALQSLYAEVERGNMRGALAAGRESSYFVVRALVYALEHRERSLSSAILYANAQELKRFTRGIPILDTSITLSPLLGLLGTVTGMMGSFSLIGGDLSAPSAITGGIAEALIATAFGLSIAIVALIPFNYLNNRVEEVRHELEAAATQLELLVAAHPLSDDPTRRIPNDSPSRALAGVPA